MIRLAIAFLFCLASLSRAEDSLDSAVKASFAFLAREHDRGQADYVVCDDRDSGFEHFFPSGWMGDFQLATAREGRGALDTKWSDNPHSGHTCVRLAMPKQWKAKNWGGVFWEFPEPNLPGPGYDLTPYLSHDEPAYLRFWARKLSGTDWASVSIRQGDKSVPGQKPYVLQFECNLSNEWQEHRFEIPQDARHHLSNVTGGFSISTSNESGPVELFVDDVAIEFGPAGRAKRLSKPRFLRSYVSQGIQEPDKYFRNACYSYDSALYILALCARGSQADLQRAAMLGDAFLDVQSHDSFADGRIRNGYMCGELLDPSRGSIPRIPGYWDDKTGIWNEDRYCLQADCGNIAWTAISLLELCKHTSGDRKARYLHGVKRMLEWIETNTKDQTYPFGYTMGMNTVEDITNTNMLKLVDKPMTAKSCEHNIDLFVAFTRMGQASGDQAWFARANHAKRFVEWLAEEGRKQCRLMLPTGTGVDGKQLNLSVAPLDVNPWAMLAFRDPVTYRPYVIEAHNACSLGGRWNGERIMGYDFNDDRDGIWWEGTAQMALAFRMMGDIQREHVILNSIQNLAFHKNERGAVLASYPIKRNRLSTGFFRENDNKEPQSRGPEEWVYWPRIHAGGATCWWLFAAMNYNPYWGERIGPAR